MATINWWGQGHNDEGHIDQVKMAKVTVTRSKWPRSQRPWPLWWPRSLYQNGQGPNGRKMRWIIRCHDKLPMHHCASYNCGQAMQCPTRHDVTEHQPNLGLYIHGLMDSYKGHNEWAEGHTHWSKGHMDWDKGHMDWAEGHIDWSKAIRIEIKAIRIGVKAIQIEMKAIWIGIKAIWIEIKVIRIERKLYELN